MLDPAPEKEIPSGYEEGLRPRSYCQFRQDLVPQLNGPPLVGIEAQHPIMGDEFEGSISKLAEPFEIALIDLLGKFPANSNSSIGAVGIKHDDLVGPGDAG